MMPVYQWNDLAAEYLAPKHSKGFGPSVTGAVVEMVRMSYEAGVGAVEHSHEREQIIVILEGRARVKVGDEERIIGPGEVVHMPSNVPHSLTSLEPLTVLSSSNLVAGVGHANKG